MLSEANESKRSKMKKCPCKGTCGRIRRERSEKLAQVEQIKL